MSIPSTFEDLPDELLLVIYRFLSSTDILSDFYGLNGRLSQTINGYYQYVSVRQVSYKQLTHMCSTILPSIGMHIRSLIISDEWLNLLSKVFLEYFGERMSSIFPQLERLTFIGFTPISLKSFLNCLTNLFELTELDIRSLRGGFNDEDEKWMLVHQLFTANDNRLTSISFDDDFPPITCKIEDVSLCYPNIEKLTIHLKSLTDFHNLLTLLPKIHSFDVTIHEIDFDIFEEHQFLPACEIKDFCLRSLGCLWNLELVETVLKRIPNVEKLSLRISTVNDFCLVAGEELFSKLSSLPLKTFNYVLFYFGSLGDTTAIYSIWKQFRQEPISIETDIGNSDLIENYGQTIKSLCFSDTPPQIVDTYVILTKCRRVKRLVIVIDEDAESKLDGKTNLCKLPCLTSLTVLDAPSMESKNFPALVEASPNLYELTTYISTLQLFFDNDFICRILGQRITHLNIILDTSRVDLDNSFVTRLLSFFPQLKCLSFDNACDFHATLESLILAIFDHLSKWNSFISFSISNANLTEDICTKGIQQWVSEHISAYGYSSFLTDYTDKIFRFWL